MLDEGDSPLEQVEHQRGRGDQGVRVAEGVEGCLSYPNAPLTSLPPPIPHWCVAAMSLSPPPSSPHPHPAHLCCQGGCHVTDHLLVHHRDQLDA